MELAGDQPNVTTSLPIPEFKSDEVIKEQCGQYTREKEVNYTHSHPAAGAPP
jgi:hypothetical protein